MAKVHIKNVTVGRTEHLSLEYLEHLQKTDIAVSDNCDSCSMLVDEKQALSIYNYLKEIYNFQ